jgi:Ala-tRNA(Pro) deacylase
MTETAAAVNPESTYDRLIALLETHNASYRVIDHAPEGRTDVVSPMRGNELRQAAKCIIVLVKLGKKTTRFLLTVIPGDRRLDLAAVKSIAGATYISFAPRDVAERLGGSAAGTILPFTFTPELELIADPSLSDVEELFFNAARLDRSLALRTKDYLAIAKPRMERIAEQ